LFNILVLLIINIYIYNVMIVVLYKKCDDCDSVENKYWTCPSKNKYWTCVPLREDNL